MDKGGDMMIKKTYLTILSVAIVSVLLGSLFYNNVILAQTSGSEYDPWLDYNEDGIIDVHDLSPLGQAYGSSGGTTKNVTVTNFPTSPEPRTIVVCENYTAFAGTTFFPAVNVTEYRYVSMFVTYFRDDPNDVLLNLMPSSSGISVAVYADDSLYVKNEWATSGRVGFEAGAPEITVRVKMSNDDIELTIVLYLYN